MITNKNQFNEIFKNFSAYVPVDWDDSNTFAMEVADQMYSAIRYITNGQIRNIPIGSDYSGK